MLRNITMSIGDPMFTNSQLLRVKGRMWVCLEIYRETATLALTVEKNMFRMKRAILGYTVYPMSRQTLYLKFGIAFGRAVQCSM